FRIDVLAGHRDTYPHTTLTSGDQRLDDQLVRHEVRRLQVDGAFGCGNGHQVHEVHALAATGWRCHEHVRIHFADRRDRRKIVLAVEYLSGGLDPVVVEGGLELRHDRTLNLEVHVAPVRTVLCMPRPLVGDPDAPGKAHLPINHQQLAMGTVVEPAQVVPLQRPVLVNLGTGVADLVEQGFVHFQAADPIHHHLYLHTRAGPLGQGISKFLADLPRPVDVGFESDRALRRTDRRQHRREDLAPVFQIGDRVAGYQAGTEQHTHLPAKLRAVGSVEVLDPALELFLRSLEVHRYHGNQQGRHGGDHDCPDHSLATPALAHEEKSHSESAQTNRRLN